jgi:hypothetical protein
MTELRFSFTEVLFNFTLSSPLAVSTKPVTCLRHPARVSWISITDRSETGVKIPWWRHVRYLRNSSGGGGVAS